MTLTTDRSNLHIEAFVSKEELMKLLSGAVTSISATNPGGWMVEITCPTPSTDHRALMFRQGIGGREFHQSVA